ncbi:PadR family transcriptional regulator [Alkalibacter mobilis]|uniref:PadR family transcriptional regulator n=1 Tax=Alkalibacter mobilis TaxID=2787712 RepID=UPI00189D9F6A|nr:PadR family transcriptional regulator [Alkalibacter mobilis]MBF7096203.1 PadR family transcriptional regulator [Alkalibacter mobilis]
MKNGKECFCHGKTNKTGKFLEASLLLLLKKECVHGYGLMEQLEKLGLTEEEMNVSTLYRTLRKMENHGFVSSDWKESEEGPKKRVYKITDEGLAELEDWIQVFEERKKRIEKFISVYETEC